VQEGARSIGSMLGHDGVEPWIVDAFVGQRRRLVETARTFDAGDWEQPSRCSAWTVHDLLIHLLGATSATRTTVTGEREVFAGGFDPNSGPASFVELRTGEPVARTLDDLEAEIAATSEAIEALRGVTPTPTCTAVWGAQVDWRLFVTHMFWDAWMHERDLLLPLGRPAPTPEAEARLATAYGLHSVGIMNGLTGDPIDVTLHLDGTGAGTYSLTAENADARVTVAPPSPGAPPMGDALLVSDAIAGRPPALGAVLDAPPDVVDALGRLAGFLNA
jgi:uncharacterized protein (TIGR03083 family)